MEVRVAYEILGLDFNSSKPVITKAYRKLSLKCHPDRCPDDPQADKKFVQLQKAYQILLNFQKQAVLSNGHEIVAKNVLSENTPTQQPPPNEFKLKLTLEEILTGCTKQEIIKRIVTDKSGFEKTEHPVVQVQVKPGSIAGTRITVSQQGDRYHGKLQANAVFIVSEEPHNIFKRDKFDLQCTVAITSKEAILGVKDLEIETLEKKKIVISEKGVITGDTVHRVPTHGLPFEGRKRGDLLVRFEIVSETQQDPPIEHVLSVTLSQIVTGCQKRVQITRKIIDDNNNETIEKQILIVDIKPGTEPGTRLRFPRKGDQKPGVISADIIFVIFVSPHEHFKVVGVDLEYTAKITEEQFFNGDKIVIPSLDKQDITFFLDGISSLTTVKKFTKRGLPLAGEPSKRGNLLVKFEVIEAFKPVQIFNMNKFVQKQQIFETISTKSSISLPKPPVPEIAPKPKIQIPENPFKLTFKHQIRSPELPPKPKIITNPFKQKLFETIPKPLSKPQVPPKPFKICKDLPIERVISVTLEHILKGCTRRVKINRRVIGPNGTESFVDKIVTINVKPGTEAGARFTFPELGDEKLGKIPADLIFILHISPHKLFRRNGANIEYDVTVSTQEISNRKIIDIPTLEKENVTFQLDELIKNGSVREMPNLGLPTLSDPTKRGYLVVNFTIIKSIPEKIVQLQYRKPPELPQQDPPIEANLNLSLKDVFYGRTVEQRIKRLIIQPDGRTVSEEKVLSINIKPGTRTGTRFRFPREGNQKLGRVPADIVFISVDVPHPIFKRFGNNVEYTVLITQEEATNGIELEIPKLEGGTIKRYFAGPIMHGMTKGALDQGLPSFEDANERGKLLVKFEVVEETFKDPPITTTIELSSEEMRQGCSQRVEYQYKFYDLEGIEQVEEKSIDLEIKPKTKADSILCIPRIGIPASSNRIPADLYVTIVQENRTKKKAFKLFSKQFK